MLLAILALAGHTSITECIRPRELITSAVSIQVFAGNGSAEPLPAKITVMRRDSDGTVVAEAVADHDGHVRVNSMTPGRYEVKVELTGFGTFWQDVRISRSAQDRMIVVGLTIPGPGQCSSWCDVAAAAGPSRAVPKCLQP